ncbi:hypothetical protein VaNZ11_014562 [Volvox africanus]|uniref:Trypsin-like serine protease n=1 Tax=Volvox africanus TaxID=51714 RepID=A0ABQ5SK30_9CHLO|nr:hypothetical protein VaNZ11_014562 [Volvox africanus]
MIFCLQYPVKRTTVIRSERCTITPPHRERKSPRSVFRDRKYNRVLITQTDIDCAPRQLSPTELAPNHDARLTLVNPSRRTLLAHGIVISSLAALSSLPLSARPSTAAALVDEEIVTSVFQAVSPSVASIAVIRPVGGVEVREVVGSGVVWDAIGPHVVTNFHVIPRLQGANTLLEVTLQDTARGTVTSLRARVAGSDSLHDLAVLKLLPPAELAGGDGGAATAPAVPPTVAPIRVAAPGDLRVGQFAYALGCVGSDPSLPIWSLSAGLVSGLGRSIPSPVGARIYGVIQTEAVVNAANSGGPLVDSLGRMVGLNTAVGAASSYSARGSGVSFALPVDLLLDLVPKIIVYGNPYGKK